MHPQQITLLISTYNWPKALELVLESVRQQSVLPKEVMIADDGSGEETRQLIERFKKDFPVPINHVWQEDKGFRKTIVLNKAIKQSTGQYIVQIDGDIILHPDFIKDHMHHADTGFFIKGCRGRLTKERAEEVLQTKNIRLSAFQKGVQSKFNATHFPLLTPFFYGKGNESRNVKGCNFAAWKADLIAVEIATF